MMVQTLIHCSPASKTEEILSRYRPIAPKPDLSTSNLWSHVSQIHLQSKPTKTRKRGFKRQKVEKPITLPLLSSIEPPPNYHVHVLEQPLDEKDLILQLKSPAPSLVSPKPVRPVGSVIRIGLLRPKPSPAQKGKSPEEVEREVEREKLPSVITDVNNKVRMANSAYKEMVGQPECLWLERLTVGSRISGEVELDVVEMPGSETGFSGWAKIEWGGKTVEAVCDVMKVNCDSKYYSFSWKFHTKQASF